MLAAALPEVLRGLDREQFTERRADLEAGGVPAELAHRVASMQSLLSVFDIVVDAGLTGSEQPVVTDAYFGIGSRLGLDWLRDRILELPRTDRWQSLARAALRDDLYRLHRSLTREILLSAVEFEAASCRSRTGWSATRRRSSAPTRCWPTSRPPGSTTPPRCRWCCASCAASSPTPVSSTEVRLGVPALAGT